MVDEGSGGRSGADARSLPLWALLDDGTEDATDAPPPRVCDMCGRRADWTLTDRTGLTQGYICVPCHDEHRRHRNRWDRRIRRNLRHAVRRS
jgi:hypothetical protein